MPAERLPTKGMSKHQRQALRAEAMALALRRHRSGEAQRWLGDPPRDRSALALGSQQARGGGKSV